MATKNESEIVQDAQNGSQKAFGELVSKYQNLVTSIAFSSTGDFQRSEDIAQQAFLIAWQKRADLADPTRFSGWLRSITRNTVLNSNRKFGRLDRNAKSLEHQNEPTTIESPSESLSNQEQQKLLWASLSNLPDEYREPLVLYYREDKSIAQVAEQLGLTNDVTKQRLLRGRAMLKEEVHQFVEDILGASKPSPSFAVSILAALPAVAGKSLAKGAATAGAKAVAKTGFFSSGLGAWMGIYGLIYGLNVSQKHTTATVEKNALFQFKKVAAFSTACLFSTIIIPFQFAGPSTRRWLLVGSIIYAASLAILTIYFTRRQKRLDRESGKPKTFVHLLDLLPTPKAEYRSTIIKATLGAWSWLYFASFASLDWTLLAVTVVAMLGMLAWRLNASQSAETIPAQMRFQAMTLWINLSCSALLFFVAEWLQYPAQLFGRPNWQVSLFVFGFATVVGLLIWQSANKLAEKLEEARLEKAQRQ